MRTLLAILALAGCLLAAGPAEGGRGRVREIKDAGGKLLDLTVYFWGYASPAEFEDRVRTQWEEVFRAYSKLLWQATDRQLRLGTVSFTVDKSLLRGADVQVLTGSGGAVADLDGFGVDGRSIYVYQETHGQTGDEGLPQPDCPSRSDRPRGQFGLLHESGHYLFGLYDEYQGCARVGGEPCSEFVRDFPVLAPGPLPAPTEDHAVEVRVFRDELQGEPYVYDEGTDVLLAGMSLVLERLTPGEVYVQAPLGDTGRGGVDGTTYARTDGAGRARFTGLSSGTYLLRPDLTDALETSSASVVDGGVRSHPVTRTPAVPLLVDAGRSDAMQVELPLGTDPLPSEEPRLQGRVRGRVFAWGKAPDSRLPDFYFNDAEDRPLAGVPVLLERIEKHSDADEKTIITVTERTAVAVTGEDGRFEFESQPQGVLFWVRTLGLAERGYRQEWLLELPPGHSLKRKVYLAADPDNWGEVRLTQDGLSEKGPFFCTHRGGEELGDLASGDGSAAPRACVMDGGSAIYPNNRRMEFCTSARLATAYRHLGPRTEMASDYQPVPGCSESAPTAVAGRSITNAQEWVHKEGCWQTIAKSAIPLEPPAGDPEDDDAGYEDPTFEMISGRLATVLAIDTSRSMEPVPGEPGSPLARAKRAATNAYVRAAQPGEYLGVVAFDTSVEREGPIQDVYPVTRVDTQGQVQRELTAFIAELEAGGFTNLRAGLDESAREVRTLQETTEAALHRIVLLSDGQETIGDDPEGALEAIGALERTAIDPVALGEGAVSPLLQRLATATGGTLYQAATPGDLDFVLTRSLAVARGEVTVATLDSRDPTSGAPPVPAGDSTTLEIQIDGFAREVSFLLAHPDAPFLDLVLESPSGVVVDRVGDVACVTPPGEFRQCSVGVALIRDETRHLYRIPEAWLEEGTWKVTVINRRIGAGTDDYKLLVTEDAPGLAIVPSLAEGGQARFPEPLALSVSVSAGIGVAGADVTARVVHPRGHVEEIVLYDSGRIAQDGDLLAGDGVYSALFRGYRSEADGGGDGTYRFEITARNVRGYPRQGGEDSDVPPDGEPVPPFTILTEIVGIVTGIPETVTAGSLALGPGPELTQVTVSVDDLNANAALSFTLSAEASPEDVEIRTLRITSSGDGVEPSIDEVSLYLDEDADGLPDHLVRPLARTQFVRDDGGALFDTGVALDTIRAGTAQHYVVTLGQPRFPDLDTLRGQWVPPPPAAPLPPLPVLALLAAVALALLLAVRADRPPRLVRPLAVGCSVLLAVALMGSTGCGGDAQKYDTFIPEGVAAAGFPEPPTKPLPGTYALVMQPTDVSAYGATTGEPLVTAGEPVTGSLTLEE